VGVFGFHPLNLFVRGLLELTALALIGLGAYRLAGGGMFGWLLGFALVLVAMVAWVTFAVPGDRSRSGNAPVAVPGAVRLIVEFDVFAAAVFLGWFVSPTVAVVFGAAVAIHYLLSLDRIRWLLTPQPSSS
jgi:hypothetical protein